MGTKYRSIRFGITDSGPAQPAESAVEAVGKNTDTKNRNGGRHLIHVRSNTIKSLIGIPYGTPYTSSPILPLISRENPQPVFFYTITEHWLHPNETAHANALNDRCPASLQKHLPILKGKPCHHRK